MRAAVPAYVGANYDDCPPGHCFGLYFSVWNEKDWQLEKTRKGEALKQTLELPDESVKQLKALRDRQSALLAMLPEESRLSLDATSTSPLATGLGVEHPLENGFAFFNPYGLPYLPGSSVKGVLRRAAEELALLENDSKGWTLAHVWRLLGFDASSEIFVQDRKDLERGKIWKQAFAARRELLANDTELVEWIRALAKSDKELCKYKDRPAEFLTELDSLKRDIHTRGTLTFWDAIPKLPKNDKGEVALDMDVMTPHYGDYYQGKTTPHDAGQPNPIVFMVVPAKSEFSFHVTCDNRRLPQSLREHWKALMQAAFEHAFAWLGFGAKTSVGYGAMKEDTEAAMKNHAKREGEEEGRRRAEENQAHKIWLATLSPEMRTIEEFRAYYRAQKAKGRYQAGGQFDEKRLALFKAALGWQDIEARREAAALLCETIREWTDWPSKKERRQEFKQWLAQLDGIAVK